MNISLSLSANSSRQLYVFWHDRDSFRMDGTQIRVFEQSDHVRLSCFLQRQHGLWLEAQVRFELLGNLADQSLEWQFSYE